MSKSVKNRPAASSKAATSANEGDTRDAKRPSKAKPAQPSKQSHVIAMLQSPKGATLEAMRKATGWQQHTIRGAMAGALKKKLGLTITSEKDETRGRVYKIT